MRCNNDCLNCSLPKCRFDGHIERNYRKTGKVGRPGKYPDGFNYQRWYQENREAVLARNKKRYEENKEKILAYQKAYREEHKDEWRKGGKYYKPKNTAHIVLQGQKSDMH